MHRESSKVKKAAKLATTPEPAPREFIFKVWTELECLMRWWELKGFTTPLL